jgi:hypothetical protein
MESQESYIIKLVNQKTNYRMLHQELFKKYRLNEIKVESTEISKNIFDICFWFWSKVESEL